MNVVRKTKSILNSISSQNLTSVRLLTHRYMVDPRVSHVLSMERNITRNLKDKYARYAKCVKLVLQQAVLGYLRPERKRKE